jgi:hypothetical protein
MQERSGEKWIEMTRGTVCFGVVKHTQAMSLFFCVSLLLLLYFLPQTADMQALQVFKVYFKQTMAHVSLHQMKGTTIRRQRGHLTERVREAQKRGRGEAAEGTASDREGRAGGGTNTAFNCLL